MHLKIKINIIISIISISTACNKNIYINDASNEIKNYIMNYSFEQNGKGSIQYWNVNKDFLTFKDTFSSDVPIN